MILGGRLPLYLGVSFFFVLSGFILTYVYPRLESRSAVRQFLWARIARVWPCHVFALGLMPLAATSSGFSLSSLWRPDRWGPNLATILLVNSWVPTQAYYHTFNTPSWSVATEFGFYLAFPILLWRLDRNWPIKLAFCLSTAIALIAYSQRMQLSFDDSTGVTVTGLLYMNPLARMFEFCLGMVAATFWRRYSPSLQFGRVAGTLAELAIIAAMITNVYYWPAIAEWIRLKTGAFPLSKILARARRHMPQLRGLDLRHGLGSRIDRSGDVVAGVRLPR